MTGKALMILLAVCGMAVLGEGKATDSENVLKKLLKLLEGKLEDKAVCTDVQPNCNNLKKEHLDPDNMLGSLQALCGQFAAQQYCKRTCNLCDKKFEVKERCGDTPECTNAKMDYVSGPDKNYLFEILSSFCQTGPAQQECKGLCGLC